MARKTQPDAAQPAFYVATEDLFTGGVGAMPVAVFRKGDRVPPAMVEPYGWADKVQNPDAAPAPEAAPPPEAAPAPPAPAAADSAVSPEPASNDTARQGAGKE